MSFESADLLVNKMIHDESFRQQVIGAVDAAERLAFVKEYGFEFTKEELDTKLRVLSEENRSAAMGDDMAACCSEKNVCELCMRDPDWNG